MRRSSVMVFTLCFWRESISWSFVYSISRSWKVIDCERYRWTMKAIQELQLAFRLGGVVRD